MHMFIFEKQKSDKRTMSAMFVNMCDCTVTGQPEGHAFCVRFCLVLLDHQQDARPTQPRSNSPALSALTLIRRVSRAHTLQTQWAHKPEVQLHELSSSSREETRCKD